MCWDTGFYNRLNVFSHWILLHVLYKLIHILSLSSQLSTMGLVEKCTSLISVIGSHLNFFGGHVIINVILPKQNLHSLLISHVFFCIYARVHLWKQSLQIRKSLVHFLGRCFFALKCLTFLWLRLTMRLRRPAIVSRNNYCHHL